MSYNRVNWINEQEGTTTPLNAENLNQMDEGIANVDTELAGVSEDLEVVKTDLQDARALAGDAMEAAENAESEVNIIKPRVNDLESRAGYWLTDAFNIVNVDNKVLMAEGVDTIGIKAGDNVNLSVNEETKEITISASGGGGAVAIDEKTIVKDTSSNKLEVPIDNSTIEVDTVSKKVKVASSITDKLSNIAIQIMGTIVGNTVTFTDVTYIGGTDDYLLDPYISDTDRFLKSQSISGHTLTVVCDDVIKSGSVAVCLAFKKGV